MLEYLFNASYHKHTSCHLNETYGIATDLETR